MKIYFSIRFDGDKKKHLVLRNLNIIWRHVLNMHSAILFANFVINYKTSEYEILRAYIC